jgi:hypothetical protein
VPARSPTPTTMSTVPTTTINRLAVWSLKGGRRGLELAERHHANPPALQSIAKLNALVGAEGRVEPSTGHRGSDHDVDNDAGRRLRIQRLPKVTWMPPFDGCSMRSARGDPSSRLITPDTMRDDGEQRAHCNKRTRTRRTTQASDRPRQLEREISHERRSAGRPCRGAPRCERGIRRP